MNRLRIIRAERRISQFRLYLKTGINASKISFIENDLIQPTEEEKRKIAKALEASIIEVFGGQDKSLVGENKV